MGIFNNCILIVDQSHVPQFRHLCLPKPFAKMKLTVATAVTIFSRYALAHGGVTAYIIDRKSYEG